MPWICLSRAFLCNGLHTHTRARRLPAAIFSGSAKCEERSGFRAVPHAFASNLLAEHADYKSVAELMWHDVAMLLRTYQHIDRQQKRQAVEKMPNILKLPKNMSQLKSKQSIEQAA